MKGLIRRQRHRWALKNHLSRTGWWSLYWDPKATFVATRQQITTVEELLEFVRVYRILWMLEKQRKIAGKMFNPQKTLQHLLILNKGGMCCTDRKCVAPSIALPYSLVIAYMVAKEYGVMVGVALHQKYCRGPHDNCF